MIQRLIMLAVLATLALPLAAAPAEIRVIEIPLDDGRLVAGDLVGHLAGAEELPADHPVRRIVDRLTWTIDLHGETGRRQLRAIDRIAGGAMTVELRDDRLMVSMPADAVGAMRRSAQRVAGSWWDELGRPASSTERPPMGISSVRPGPRYLAPDQLREVPTRVVLLVHGLDEPGHIWDDLMPVLLEAGYDVMRFEYPNDGSIGDSADLMAIHLARLRALGVRRVDVVAHSMGGLVSRDVLTRPAYRIGDGALGDRFPAIDRLIMIGTPNHGSSLARLRGVGELRERVVRLFSGEGLNLDPDTDGAGEAGYDLLPDSDFLRRLNARAHPPGTRMSIIAGRWIPVRETDIAEVVESARELAESPSAPAWLREWVDDRGDRVETLLNGAITGLGDGVVALESARLDGVDDFVIVEANHISLVHNPLPVGGPPVGIPLVLERLGR